MISVCPLILRSWAWGQVGVSKPGDQVNLFLLCQKLKFKLLLKY